MMLGKNPAIFGIPGFHENQTTYGYLNVYTTAGWPFFEKMRSGIPGKRRRAEDLTAAAL